MSLSVRIPMGSFEFLLVTTIELHEQLLNGIKEGGTVGEAAKAVADVLHQLFEKEEWYALPPSKAAEGKR
jgi:hypothetical protein